MESSNPQNSDLEPEPDAPDELDMGISRRKEELRLCEANDLWSGSKSSPLRSDVDPERGAP